MKSGIQIVAVLMLSALSAAAHAQSSSGANSAPASPTVTAVNARPLRASDQEFFRKAGSGGLAEVAAGQLAGSTSGDEDVKSFAGQMVRDHTKANDELAQLAQDKGVTLPQAPDSTQQKNLDQLKHKQGADFDKAYVKGQVADHKATIRLFKKAYRSQDPDIAAFAQKTLPTLKMHLVMVKALQKKLPR